MATIKDFAIRRGWSIQKIDWSKSTLHKLPAALLNSFQAEATTLLIGLSEGSKACTITWLDDSHHWRTIHDLHEQDGDLVARKVTLWAENRPYAINLSLDLSVPDDPQLTMKIMTHRTDSFGDEVVGTFTATANPGGVNCPAPRRSPHWLGWLGRLKRFFQRPEKSGLARRTAV